MFFLKFYFFLCQELQDNEEQRFSNYVNVNQFKGKPANFHVMWRDIYLYEATAPGLLSSQI